MPQRRLFSPDIVRSDAFLEMPPSTRELYFQLCMDADDDGFVNPKRVVRMVNASDDDLKLLIFKRFALPFQNGVIVIKHWLIHNSIRKDRYKPTQYTEEKKTLIIKENGAYSDNSEDRQPTGNQRLPQGKLSKGKLSQVNLIEESVEIGEPIPLTPKEEATDFFQNEERQQRLVDVLIEKGVPAKAAHEEVYKFIVYWTEPNGTGKKLRWQMEVAFEINRRLATWFSRAKSFNNYNSDKRGVSI